MEKKWGGDAEAKNTVSSFDNLVVFVILMIWVKCLISKA